MTHSLRGRLLAWVMLPLAGAVVLAGVVGRQNAESTATVVQDRLLLGSARIVAEQLRFEDGSIQDPVPPAALELFQSSDIDSVYYRVITSDGRTVTGYSEFPLSDARLQPETSQFFDTVVRGQAVRAVVYLQPVLTETGIQPVRVQIAQTLHGRAALVKSLWMQAMVQQLAALALVALLVWLGLRNCLKPLLQLRDAVLARRPGSLHALELAAVPVELSPLVDAINEYAIRLERHTSVQRLFIQNAAHQLRTPLTLLTTQVSYAIRASEPMGRSESLSAIRQTVQQSVRLVNQLLTLSSAEVQAAGDLQGESGRLDEVVRRVLEDMAGRAQSKDIDLGFEASAVDIHVRGHAVTLREIVTNLVDNAIRYTQPGGIVTTRIVADDRRVTLSVEDNGPGIPLAERERVFQRFYRLNDSDSDGCGLGLAIVKEFAEALGADVALRTPASGAGVTVEVGFVAATRSDLP
ncbi:sensor histidine kinase [Scleromatobacter humisilvae]|uniref:histidine kinase n=1 Tax=Scleromatobacter humisilvae TaxID=2897159 RepID=A0A9X1YG44_9BURK|nr:sensor histidine kinase [Scleromatobacter humisilvae]MCK9685331.1 sensor histidine kinase [Scleromatobacter humisilvae]